MNKSKTPGTQTTQQKKKKKKKRWEYKMLWSYDIAENFLSGLEAKLKEWRIYADFERNCQALSSRLQFCLLTKQFKECLKPCEWLQEVNDWILWTVTNDRRPLNLDELEKNYQREMTVE